ncbi:proton channel OTOP2 [Pogona vitticeps]|uniref:Otopetrin-2 n=1 Tax=Pogona vitticeps TaxID=103695 RepID=A0A6J0UML9_9SAUR|nr:otopetrin-2 [Pogona vitticeps]XP_020661962.1 otopetrin-2 [Pogona vitticeps]XP_020661963.1 otopetrin-2 [Pogona vitticeps]XP_020661964.1 otopetrin-2 [Pogona vitticeps]XP_020661965.1 otopetrin-2 [Pogona vitticeps]
MTELSIWKDSEIRREDSIMGSDHKEDKSSFGPDPLSPTGHHHKFPSSSSHSPKEVWKKGGRVFSVLLAVNLVLLACTLVSGGAFQDINLHDYDVFFMLTIVMLITIAWMLFYIFNTSRRQNAIPCKDNHAGPIWLRGGLVLFAVLTLVMDVFKTGYYSSFSHCLSVIKIMYPIVQAVFVVIQTYFLWVSAKDCVHVHLDLTRCGLMLTLTTNLAVWMSAVTDESVHKAQSKNPNANNTHRMAGFRSSPSDSCPCDNNLCQIFQNGYFWLYPFNIEYSLFASAMVYVMWKNVGRLIDHHANYVHHLKFKLFRRTYFLGIIVGLLILMTGIGVLIVYEVQINSKDKSEAKTNQVLSMYYIFNIICLSLMSLASIGGSIVYRFDKRDMDRHKNPTRTLDVALLMGAALGQYAISYYSIVATVASKPRDTINALNLSYSLLMIAQHTFQNIFIIEGLHRQPVHKDDKAHSREKDIYGLTFVNLNAVSLRVPESGSIPPPVTPPDVSIQTPPEVTQCIKITKKVNWRRTFLKDSSLFLLLCNVILWIMPAFGARPQFDNTTELRFYGYPMWAAIVDICLPFGIFYRMHAVASLLEVYIMS